MTFTAYLDRRRQVAEQALAAALPASSVCPPVILDAMRYSLLGGGKRLRPLLLLAAYDAVRGVDDDDLDLALPAACAIEMIHTYSLIHDDLPAMDDDALRRGRPTSHVVYGEGLAILAGDGLQAEAFALLARLPSSADPVIQARKLQTLLVIAEASGATGMVGGQAVDLLADPTRALRRREPAAPLTAADLADMHARKTGALIRAAVAAGAIMAGAAPPLLAALDAYGRAIGLAFQIVDDILDVEGQAADLGKTAGKDAVAGKPTYVSAFGLDGARGRADACLGEALASLVSVGLADSPLSGMARWVVERRA